MVRHVCGTCRFLQASDPGRKSGWCGHPQRQTTTDVHILVRGGELNCRNDWDKDLWQLREDGDRVLDISMARASDHSNSPRQPERPDGPRTLGHDSPLIGQPTGPAQPLDDILIGEDLDAPRLVSEDINREMLRRAREQYRARRLSTRPDGPVPRLDDASSPGLHRAEPIVISNEVQPFQIGQEPGPDLTRISGRDRGERGGDRPSPAEQRGAFSSVPEREEAIELPRRAPRRLDAIPTVNDFEMETFRTYDEVVEGRAKTASPARRSEPIDRPAEPLDRPVERLGRPSERHDQPMERPEPPSERIDRPSGRLERPSEGWERSAEPRERAGERIAVERRQTTTEEPATWEIDDRYDDDSWIEPEEAAPADTPPSTRGAALQTDVARSVEPDEIRPWGYVEPRRSRPSNVDARESARLLSPSMSKLWDDVPRCCRTCRDFRPAEAGGRGGWCTNRWAFRHRRMVDVDQLTCETTIGDWWLPTDDAWQDDFDVGRHALATPLMDKWFGRVEEEAETDYPLVASRTRRRS